MVRLARRRMTAAAAVLLAALAASGIAVATVGNVREFKLPARAQWPQGIAKGAAGAVWYTVISTPGIGRRDSSGFSFFPLPNPAVAFTIVSGPDGALWFTESSGRGIGRITTSGDITEFDVPACNDCGYPHGPLGLTVGSDGALWYARPGNETIGRVTRRGHITEFPVGSTVRDVTWITTGPDGALWFTDDGGIGRRGTDGTISQIWSGL